MARGARGAVLLFCALPALFASCSDKSNPVQPVGGENAAMETHTLALINQKRAEHNPPLPAFVSADPIVTQARIHSIDMANGTVAFGHDGFTDRLAEIKKSIDWISGAENVAFNGGFPDPAAKAVDDWMNSPGHYANIMGEYDRTGIGIAKTPSNVYYFTQIFIKTR
jgi:uncharacterized protein YkwD